LQQVGVEVRRLHANVPERIKLAETAVAAEERRIANFIAFIGDGKGTRALADALEAAERRANELRGELAIMRVAASSVFEAPPIEWVKERVARLGELLEQETARSFLTGECTRG
jgi:regulator of protease activity HflC (stomatin/prohibitin superfamily)